MTRGGNFQSLVKGQISWKEATARKPAYTKQEFRDSAGGDYERIAEAIQRVIRLTGPPGVTLDAFFQQLGSRYRISACGLMKVLQQMHTQEFIEKQGQLYTLIIPKLRKRRGKQWRLSKKPPTQDGLKTILDAETQAIIVKNMVIWRQRQQVAIDFLTVSETPTNSKT